MTTYNTKFFTSKEIEKVSLHVILSNKWPNERVCTSYGEKQKQRRRRKPDKAIEFKRQQDCKITYRKIELERQESQNS